MRFGFLSLLVCFFSVLPCLASAEIYSAKAMAHGQEQAKEQVLVELASALFVHIESESVSVSDSRKGVSATSTTKMSTNLPILGAQVNCFPKQTEVMCHGVLDSSHSAPLYVQLLTQLKREIENTQSLLGTLDQATRVETLNELLNKVHYWSQLHKVLGLLDAQAAQSLFLAVEKAHLQSLLLKHQQKATSLSFAAKQLLKGVIDKAKNKGVKHNVYLAPATPVNSREITQFSNQLKLHMQAAMAGLSTSYANADHFLRGEYLVHSSGMTVSYVLTNRMGDIISTEVAELIPAVYEGMSYQPQTVNFDQLLHSGYVVSSDFQVSIQTNKGLRDLSFVEGEVVELFVKLNQPGYFYIVGHTKNALGEKSYLLELQDAPDNNKFIQYVNLDDANRWVSMGEFQVEPPYGLEGLQVLAYKNKPLQLIPGHYWDGRYWVVANDLATGVATTRGLVKKRKKEDGLSSVESVITFHTFAKRASD
ncbi:hypothetical protein [Litoribacillus peritrichatus]|uniref:Surface layer protein A domain-containing protein n=1 Tax=Litoribacillus peritrichatus TaxID=718191 RepID=A0ABP7N636_9GAMM